MKKTFLSFAFAVITVVAFGQSHQAGDKNLNVGIGIGSRFATGDISIPPVGVSYEVGIKDNISIGGYLGYSASKNEVSVVGSTWAWKYTYIIVGARGAYHLDIDNDKIDPYGGLLLGYNIASVKWDGSGNDPGTAASAGGFTYSLFVGSRYAFTEKLGAFAELGYGISWLQLGLNLKM